MNIFKKSLWAMGLTVILLGAGCVYHPSAPVTDLSPLDRSKTVYTVKKGDTLHSIAFRTAVDYQNIAKWNTLSSPYRIYVGDVLALRASKAKEAKAPEEVASQTKQSKTRLASEPILETSLPSIVQTWQWPAIGQLTQTYSPAKSRYGIQIKAQRSSPIVSAAKGQVMYAGDAIKGYGELVIVKHSDKFISAYAHNDQILVKEGDTVEAGQMLARMGSTGTNSVKLHFEIRRNGEPVNPLKYLPAQQG